MLARGVAPDEEVYCCLGCRLAASITGGGQGALEFLESRLLLSAFLSMGVMTFSLVLYGEAVYDAESDSVMRAVRGVGSLVLAMFSLPVFALLGLPLLRGAWLDLRQGQVRMDGLIALATIAALALSLTHTFSGEGPVYYDTATMVLVLVTFGRRLEAHARVQGRDAADELAELLPEHAHRARGAAIEDIAPGELRKGDEVEVRPGEAVPADVRVLTGKSEIVAAHLTGEGHPRPVEPGDTVPAGALNGTGVLAALVERPAEDGSLGRMRRLLESPLAGTRLIRLTDRLAGWLVLVAAVLAVAGGAWSLARGGAGAALTTGLSVLLVACPCALGLATPLAYRAMRAALARRGILARDPAALEAAAEVDHVLLDKTGTITDPQGRLVAVPGSAAGTEEKLAALIGPSGHPLSAAVTRRGRAVPALEVVPGLGVEATLDGRRCRAGSPTWMDRDGLSWGTDLDERRVELARRGATLVAVAENDAVVGLAALEQSVRPSAGEAVRRIRALGATPEIVSGDHEDAVGHVARALGSRGRGGLRPEDKLARVAELRRTGRRVLLVGDGINDAPALRQADVGVAIGTATAAARTHAGVEVLGDDLTKVPDLLEAARVLRRCVRGNLAWTAAYNAVALGLAATGRLHPLAAAASMIASSLVVAWRSYRLLDHAPRAGAPAGANPTKTLSP